MSKSFWPKNAILDEEVGNKDPCNSNIVDSFVDSPSHQNRGDKKHSVSIRKGKGNL